LMAAAYAAARVLVLPSELEFPGLVALEAGLAGCQVAVTGVGCAREYLGEHAEYLDPYSLDSIRQAVLACYARGAQRNTRLQEHVERNFLWDAVVRRNIEGYRMILDGARTRPA